MRSVRKTSSILLWVAIFAIAMGYLESAVVIYIRKIYYPEGFDFPLKVLGADVLITEIFRELATIVMLIGIGIMAGRSRIERFGLFLYTFGIWDIFYYVFLKALIGWPASLFTWDILFMIPTTWVGPVIAPMLNALTMVVLGGMITNFQGKHKNVGLRAGEWLLLVIGSLVLFITYMQDYTRYMLKYFSVSDLFFSIPSQGMLEYATQYVPVSFNWWLFGIGQALIAVPLVLYYMRLSRRRSMRY